MISPSHRRWTGWLLAAALATTPARAQQWARDAVWYQIFPDRFHNGDPTNDPGRDRLERPVRPSANWRITPWTGDWYARAEWERELGPDFYRDGVFDRRYGGDLQGIIGRLPYLGRLGINAIYLNPVFLARSLHRYDGDSFHHIDPHLGPDPDGDFRIIAAETPDDPETWRWTAADRLFLELLESARERGIRIIIDGVWNHTGRDFFAFADLRANQHGSPFKDWYAIESFDDPGTPRDEFRYRGWSGYNHLPEFAETADGRDMAPGPKRYIFAATKRWMDPDGDGDPRDGVAGWRLDVAGERPVEFWADWHAHVRSINPDAYTVCEEWHDARRLIEDGGFSAAMNYHAFAFPVWGYLISGTLPPSRFAALLEERRAALPAHAAPRMQNLIGSHDTERLASMIVNAGLKGAFDPARHPFSGNGSARESPDYQVRKPDARERAIQRMVVLFQMTAVGAPMIYYGDEAGMWGGNDPDDRMPMVWEDMDFAPQAAHPRGRQRQADRVAFDRGLFDFYRSAVAMRRGNSPLTGDAFRLLAVDDAAGVLAFARGTGKEQVVVAFNRGGRPYELQLESLPARPRMLLATGGATVRSEVAGWVVSLPEHSAAAIRGE